MGAPEWVPQTEGSLATADRQGDDESTALKTSHRSGHTTEVQFHTGWFVESLATQTLVLFVIRTAKNPLRSRPSRPLIASCLAAVAIGIFLPFSPLAGALGFTVMPLSFFSFLAVATAAYLVLVEFAKRRLLRHAAKANAVTHRNALAAAA